MKEEKHDSKRRKGYLFLVVLCGIGFLACVGWLVMYQFRLTSAEQQLENIKDSYVQENITPETEKPSVEEIVPTDVPGTGDATESSAEEDVEETDTYPGVEGFNVPEKQIDFKALQEEENADIYAWITVPGTKIDYPIVQHPEEPEYYLEHNLDGSKGYPGCIYTELYNSKDWDDPHTVLYGHNMKNGTMFAGLHYYEDSEFFEDNQYVYIYTEKEVLVYQIFAAYEFSNAHLILGFNTQDEDSFNQYLEGIFQIEGINNHFNEEIEVTAEDKIITLATCIANKPDKRYLVQAVLVARGTNE